MKKKLYYKSDDVSQKFMTFRDDANLVAWYKSSELSSIIKDENNLVSEWQDLSGNGRDLYQELLAKQPTFTPNQRFGKPAIAFDGSTTRLLADAQDSGGGPFDPQSGPFFVYMVYQQTFQAGYPLNVWIMKGNRVSTSPGYSVFSENNFFTLRCRTTPPNNSRAAQDRADLTDFAIIGYSMTGSEVIGYLNNSNSGWSDGGGGATGNTYFGFIGNSNIDFIVGSNDIDSGNALGNLYEIIILSKTPTSDERLDMQAYFEQEYGKII